MKERKAYELAEKYHYKTRYDTEDKLFKTTCEEVGDGLWVGDTPIGSLQEALEGVCDVLEALSLQGETLPLPFNDQTVTRTGSVSRVTVKGNTYPRICLQGDWINTDLALAYQDDLCYTVDNERQCIIIEPWSKR